MTYIVRYHKCKKLRDVNQQEADEWTCDTKDWLEIQIQEEPTLVVNADSDRDQCYVPINYCPFCRKKL